MDFAVETKTISLNLHISRHTGDANCFRKAHRHIATTKKLKSNEKDLKERGKQSWKVQT